MKNEDVSFWLYLEPYTLIFKGKGATVVYNTLNGCYLRFVDDVVVKILDDLLLLDKGYCIPVNIKMAKNRFVISFIRKIRSTFSGDIFVDRNMQENNKPFIFLPKLCLYHDVERIKKEQGKSLGEVILRNLTDVTCFLPGVCTHSCKFCSFYCKQFVHCSKFDSIKKMTIDDYRELFERLEVAGLSKLNLVLNSLSLQFLQSLLTELKKYTFEVEFYLDVKNIDQNIKYILMDNYRINISISLFDYNKKEISDLVSSYNNDNIYWNCILDNNTCFDMLDDSNYNITLLPFYNGENELFFSENVYISMSDILDSTVSKQQIFRRQILNEFYFGKLIILPSGDTYANINLLPLGNILENSLASILLNEFENSTSWLKLRDGEICGKCENRYLCPSISNYEFVIGKENLCHVYSK